MAHAFVHWHAGARELADAAWAASGEAMMRSTTLTKLCAARGTGPAVGADLPALKIAQSEREALAADQRLAESCAAEAKRAAAACHDEELARYCTKLAGYAETLAAWQPPATHPASGGNPKFESFQATYEKFVRPAA